MQVTTIIPTYNRRERLLRALDSVHRQQWPVAQTIVIDDGSTDGSERAVKRQFPRVEYLYQKNRGVSAARNWGILTAEGSWIALLDSDDEWTPEKLKLQVEAVRRNPGLLFCHTDEIWIRRGKRVNPHKKHKKQGGMVFKHCLPLCVISPSSALIHRSVFARVGLFDESFPACEDYDLWLRICSVFPTLFVEQPLVIKYGGHDDQLSQRFWGMDRFRIRALEKILSTSCLDQDDFEAARSVLLKKIDIFLAGAERRGHKHDVDLYRHKRTYWASQ